MPYCNQFLINGNMIKKKTLPFYEDNQLNFYIRSRSNPLKVREFYEESKILKPTMHAGNLWTTIKKIFKKGKDYAQKTMDFVDNSPLLNTIKDIGFDYIQNKTGYDVGDYYNTAKNVINMTKDDATKVVKQLGDTTRNQLNKYYKTQQDAKKNNKPAPKFNYKDTLKQYYNDIVQTVPQYQPAVKQNFDLFSSGLDNYVSSGGKLNDTVNRNLIKFLVLHKTPKGYGIHKDFKDILLKHGLKTLTVPKVLQQIADKVLTEKSKGRLNLGSGDELSGKGRLNLGSGECSGTKTQRYNEILKKLSK